MNILIATVEHSGTFATLRELGWRLDGRGRQVCPLSEKDRAQDGMLLQAHLYDSEIENVVAYARENPTVLTYRPESELRASWMRRNKKDHEIVTDLDSQIANYERVLELNPTVVQTTRESGLSILKVGAFDVTDVIASYRSEKLKADALFGVDSFNDD